MSELWQVVIAMAVIIVVVMTPVAIGTTLHLRENKKRWGCYFP